MTNLMNYKGYIGTIEYTEEDGVLFGKLAGIRDSVSYHADSIHELKKVFEESVDDYLEFCRADGKEPNKTSKEMLQEEMLEKFASIMKDYIAM